VGSGYFTNPLQFILGTIFSLYIAIVMLRFLFQLTRADFYNPLSQFIVKATDPLLKPLRRLIPGWGGIDVASIVLMIVLQMLATTILFAIVSKPLAPWPLFVVSLSELTSLLFNIYIYGIIILAIISWINPGTYNPVVSLIQTLTEPVMRPVRNVIPPMSGLDLSPLFVILGLVVIKMLVLPLFGLLL